MVAIMVYTLLTIWIVGSFLIDFFCQSRTIDNDYVLAIQELHRLNSDIRDKIVIFGSSMGREGIDSQYLQQTIGEDKVSVYNFSISSGKPSDFYLIYRQITEKEKIKLVVLTISPWAFEKMYTGNIKTGVDVFTNLAFKPTPIFEIMGWPDTGTLWFLRESVISAVPIYKYNEYFQKIIDQKNLSFWKQPQEKAKLESWRQYRYPENKPEEYFIEELKKEKNYEEYRNINYDWEPGENLQIRALVRLIRGLEEKAIPVLVVDMPVNPYKQAFYEEGLVESYSAAVRLALGQSRFTDFSFTYPKEDFVDFNHLNSRGRERFSQDLADILKNSYGF